MSKVKSRAPFARPSTRASKASSWFVVSAEVSGKLPAEPAGLRRAKAKEKGNGKLPTELDHPPLKTKAGGIRASGATSLCLLQFCCFSDI